VQQGRELRRLVGAGVAEDIGDGLCVGQPLARAHAGAVIGIEQEADRSRPRGETLGDSGRHAPRILNRSGRWAHSVTSPPPASRSRIAGGHGAARPVERSMKTTVSEPSAAGSPSDAIASR
jgi:hypothetical protein